MIPEISRIYGTRVAEIRGGANIGSRWGNPRRKYVSAAAQATLEF